MGLTMRSGPVPFDQPISRVWKYYAEMMHCIQITALIAFFWVLVLFCFPSVTMCAYYARYNVEIKELCLVLSYKLNITASSQISIKYKIKYTNHSFINVMLI